MKTKKTIVLHRIGDFYEATGEDAKVVRDALDLTMTSRQKNDERVDMCGFPVCLAGEYSKRLATAGYATIFDEGAPCGLVQQEFEILAETKTVKKQNEKGVWDTLITLGVSNRAASHNRQNEDYYATDSVAIDRLARAFQIPHNIYECACGAGHLSERLKDLGHNVYSTDLFNRGYGEQVGVNFLTVKSIPQGFSILTNPPFKHAKEFVLKALNLVGEGQYVIMLLRLLFLEGKTRKNIIFDKTPPRYVFVCSERLTCAKNADFHKCDSPTLAYAWFVWKKGDYSATEIKWI